MCINCNYLNALLETPSGTTSERIQWINEIKRCKPVARKMTEPLAISDALIGEMIAADPNLPLD